MAVVQRLTQTQGLHEARQRDRKGSEFVRSFSNLRGGTARARSAPGAILQHHEVDIQGGCSCKLGAQILENLLTYSLQNEVYGAVQCKYPEDCGRVSLGDQYLLSSVDFGPVVGRDIFVGGQIQGLNALSDVYACGGAPLSADVVLIIDEKWGWEKAAYVESGVREACREDGVELVGGHTVLGQQTMVGLSVTGIVDKRFFISKRGATKHHVLLISKPLGVGLVARGFALGQLGEQELEEAVQVMTLSNRVAGEAARAAEVSAMTDVTGFGLLGHLVEMLMGSNLGAVIELSAVPLLESVTRVPETVMRTKYLQGNLDYVAAHRTLTGLRSFHRLAALLDPQTNGGLLAAAGSDAADSLIRGGLFQPIGVFTDTGQIEIVE